jgi:hypothetical protein
MLARLLDQIALALEQRRIPYDAGYLSKWDELSKSTG